MKEMDQKWAACIVYYQDQDSLNNLLNSLESQTLKPTNVFIADNYSKESIRINSFSFPVKIIRLDENKGFAGGANVAINEAIDSNITNLMLLSQDVLLENDSAQKLITKLNVSGGIVFPTMMNRNDNTVFSKGGKISKLSGSIKLAIKDDTKNIDWADGSCLIFTSELFKSVNGLNEKFFMYFEDMDLSVKVRMNNLQIIKGNIFFFATLRL
jgi:GT2 family glycosyltransferase